MKCRFFRKHYIVFGARVLFHDDKTQTKTRMTNVVWTVKIEDWMVVFGVSYVCSTAEISFPSPAIPGWYAVWPGCKLLPDNQRLLRYSAAAGVIGKALGFCCIRTEFWQYCKVWKGVVIFFREYLCVNIVNVCCSISVLPVGCWGSTWTCWAHSTYQANELRLIGLVCGVFLLTGDVRDGLCVFCITAVSRFFCFFLSVTEPSCFHRPLLSHNMWIPVCHSVMLSRTQCLLYTK